MNLDQKPKPKAGFHQTVRNIATNRHHFGLSHHAVDYLRHAAECVSPGDLKDGRTPWCYERVDDMALLLGVSPRSVHNIEKRLHALGLIERKPMANGHRGAKRCRRSGELLWAHGVSLAPLVTRRDEIAAIEQNRADRERAYRITRNKVHAARARLKEMLVAALEFPALADLRSQMWAIHDAFPTRLTRSLFELDDLMRVDAELTLALDTLVEAMEALVKPAPEAGDNGGFGVNISDASEAGCRHKYLTTPLDLYSCSKVEPPIGDKNADIRDPADTGPCLDMKSAGGENGRNPKSAPLAQITPRKLLDLAPERWRDALEGMERIDWSVIGFVASARRAELGVSERAWRTGVDRMGPRQAALCLAILDTNRDHPTRAGVPVLGVGQVDA